MKKDFEDYYPEFGKDGADILAKHLKECGMCGLIFQLYKNLKEEKSKEIMEAYIKGYNTCLKRNGLD